MVTGIGTFGHRQLAENDRSGADQARNYCRVIVWSERRMDRGAQSRWREGSITQILNTQRNSMQRAPVYSLSNIVIRFRRASQRIFATEMHVTHVGIVNLVNP